MPGRNPAGAAVDSKITSDKIDALNTKISTYNTAKTKTLIRVTS